MKNSLAAGHTPGNVKGNSSGRRKRTPERKLYFYREIKITGNGKYVGKRRFKERTLTMLCGVYNICRNKMYNNNDTKRR